MPDFKQLFPTLNSIKNNGIIRTYPEDFTVTEINTTELSGIGEHLWLSVRKTNSNTEWVAKHLSNICQVPLRQVGFAGLKDRHAVTTQWFSVQLAKITDIDKINAALPAEISVIKAGLHSRKIKTGQLDANKFELVIRNITGEKAHIEANIAAVRDNGVPNYFGPQRFGHDMGNIQKAQDWFAGKLKLQSKTLKSLLISTARSHIFNSIIAQRISDNLWHNAIDGDILQLNASHSWFPSSAATEEEIKQRLKTFDIHLTAAMYGEDSVQSSGLCAHIETEIAAQFPQYQQGMQKFRLKQDRRAMRICPQDLQHQWQDTDLHLNFSLLPGAYATSVLREIIDLSEAEIT